MHGALERKGPIARTHILVFQLATSMIKTWPAEIDSQTLWEHFLLLFVFEMQGKQPFKLEACLFIVVLALAWLPNANTNCTTLKLAKWIRVTFQMICCFLVCMYTLCQTQVWLQIGVASLLSLNLPRLQHCNIFLLYRWSLRFQFLNWLAKIAEVQ